MKEEYISLCKAAQPVGTNTIIACSLLMLGGRTWMKFYLQLDISFLGIIVIVFGATRQSFGDRLKIFWRNFGLLFNEMVKSSKIFHIKYL